MRRLFDRVFHGNDEMYAKAVHDLDEAIAKYGADHAMQFPDTAYNCATILEYTGIKVTTLADLKKALDGPIKDFMTRKQRTHDVFTSGFATAMAAEVIEACKYVEDTKPYGDEYWGHMTDAEVRELGLPLVTKDIPGFVVFIGPAPSDEEARDMIKGYQQRGKGQRFDREQVFLFLHSKKPPVCDLSTRRRQHQDSGMRRRHRAG